MWFKVWYKRVMCHGNGASIPSARQKEYHFWNISEQLSDTRIRMAQWREVVGLDCSILDCKGESGYCWLSKWKTKTKPFPTCRNTCSNSEKRTLVYMLDFEVQGHFFLRRIQAATGNSARPAPCDFSDDLGTFHMPIWRLSQQVGFFPAMVPYPWRCHVNES